jgi:2'-phosphotransferase
MKHTKPKSDRGGHTTGTDPRRPRSGRGGGGGGSNDPSRRISHALSWVLRHSAIELGLPISKDGYVPIDLLIQHSHRRLKDLTLEKIHHVVTNNDKQRFKLEEKNKHDFEETAGPLLPQRESFLCIRANQGHSIKGIDAEALLQPINSTDLAAIPTIVHGTYRDPWRNIQKSGLSKMGRNHIHFATGLLGEDGVISGLRKSCDIYIYINPVKCAHDGIKFYQSDNGVLLTAGVNAEGILPLSYGSHVMDWNGNILLDQR